MRIIKQLIIALFFLTIASPLTPALAGSSQAVDNPTFETQEIIDFAKKVEKAMAEKGARVALLARVGRDRKDLPEGVNYTHVGIAVYSQITTSDGRKISGYSIYNLYQRAKEPDVSDLIQDYPVDFFAGAKILEAGIIIPTPELQKRLLQVISSPTYQKLHTPHYSVIANPFTEELQNCTEHTLDLIAAAIYQTDDIKIIKANLKAYFIPQPVKVSPIKLLLGSMLVADVATSDHPGPPETTTFTTIAKFLTSYKAASAIMTVLPGS